MKELEDKVDTLYGIVANLDHSNMNKVKELEDKVDTLYGIVAQCLTRQEVEKILKESKV